MVLILLCLAIKKDHSVYFVIMYQRWSRDTLLLDRDETLEYRHRDETRLYISCFGLSQGCEVRVRSRSGMSLVGVGTEVVFQIC